MAINWSAEERAATEVLLGGRSVHDLRFLPTRATFAVGDDSDRAKLASFRSASIPMVTDGYPTILRATAWLAHEGENKNGLIFVKEELGAAAARIKEPNFLIMDFNHSAVRVSDHPKAIGLWHRATMAFDSRARGIDGTRAGAWGILLEGISWAWAFPDYAAELIAEQDRHGAVRFSMACLPTASEFIEGADGRQREIAHDPIFFTNSSLNVPNADPDAWGFMTDNDQNVQDAATQNLLAASTITASTTNVANYTLTVDPSWIYIPNTTTGVDYVRLITTASKEHVPMSEPTLDLSALTAKVAELAAENETLKANLVSAEAVATERDRALAEAEAAATKLAETETSRDALVAELASSRDMVTKYETEIAGFMAERAAKEQEQFEAAKRQKLAERIDALPESYRAVHAKKSDEAKARVETKWADMTDEAWDAYRDEELLVGLSVASESKEGMYLRKSRAEGALPLGGAMGEVNSRKSRIRALLDK